MTEWAHFVGERYTPASFLSEAGKYGIARNVPLSTLMGMKFGDIVNLLQWDPKEKRSTLFAQFEFSSVTIRNPDVAEKVTQKLLDEGRAEPVKGGGRVKRVCGSYYAGGGASVDDSVSASELVDLAKSFAGDEPLHFMAGGRVARSFVPPVFLGANGPKFRRGFFRFTTGAMPAEKHIRNEIKSAVDYQSAA